MVKGILGAAVLAVAAFGGAAALDDNTVRDDNGAIIEGGGLGAFKVRIGDCFNVPVEELVMSLEAIPCDQPHDAEAYATFVQAGTDYPGEEAVTEASTWGCYDRYEAFVGIPWDDSQLDYWFLEPTVESWEENDDREVTCALTSYDGAKLTGSMQGSNL